MATARNGFGLTRRAAAVLDLRDRRSGPDRLALPADRRQRPVARIEADQRRSGQRLGQHVSDG
jgi:hypothetical protein